MLLIFQAIPFLSRGQEGFVSLKKLSMEELLNMEVTSVSKHPERLAEVASAIQVITSEDIRYSGATNVPEALRLAANLQVAQVNSSQWAISARGFNNVLANKLLVLIDGRTVYTPMYAGVYWDVQNVLLEDVDRIEVISGPGGTLWGANAVNGVINIITKKTNVTQGTYTEAGAGNQLLGMGSIRHGGKIAKNISYRAYAMGFKRGSTVLATDESKANDSWTMGQGGFQMNWTPSEKNDVTLQSNVYDGRPDPDGNNPVIARGSNVITRWTHTTSEKSDFQLQLYYDQTWRDFRNGFTERLTTFDFDGQHRFKLGNRNEIIWGLGARSMDHDVQNLELFGFNPAHKNLHIYNVFVQDEIVVIPERFRLVLGSKFEHNVYTGWQLQPNARLVWSPSSRNMLWTAVSRSVRTPSRLEREFSISLAPGIPLLVGNPDFTNEELLAYELGWRFQPDEKLSFSLSSFYNIYSNIRSAEPGPPPFGIPIMIANGVEGNTYGIELSGNYRINDSWRVRGGYTFLEKELKVKPSSNDANGGTAESNDPQHQILVQAMTDISRRIELSVVSRYTSALPKPVVAEYVALDLKIAWRITNFLELNVIGQNLLSDYHAEFVPSSPAPREIPRSIFGKIICRF